MQYFWKTIGLILISVILWLVLEKRDKDYGTLMTLAVCCAVTWAGTAFLQPLLEFMNRLMGMGSLEEELLGTLYKAVGIGLTAELTGMVCSDAGNSSMAAMARILGSAAILYVSIPLMETLMNLIQDILGVL